MTDSIQPIAGVLTVGQRARHPSLWLDDGTLVIATKSMLFKVYRGLLSRHSDFFRDMFNLPQSKSMETFEGVPMIECHDEPEDVAHFLHALVDPLYVDSALLIVFHLDIYLLN